MLERERRRGDGGLKTKRSSYLLLTLKGKERETKIPLCGRDQVGLVEKKNVRTKILGVHSEGQGISGLHLNEK